MKKNKKNLRNKEVDDTDIYDEEYMEELLDGDEISAEEQAFMIGYNKAV